MRDKEMIRLVEALRGVFSDTELHALIFGTMSYAEMRQQDHWQTLRKALVQALNCDECQLLR